MRKIGQIVLLFSGVLMLSGCPLDNILFPPPEGFYVHTLTVLQLGNGIQMGGFPRPYVPVVGFWESDWPGATGGTYNYSRTTDFGGVVWINSGRAPAQWRHQATCVTRNPLTGARSVVTDTRWSIVFQLDHLVNECADVDLSSKAISTRFSIAGSEPETLTVGGWDLTSQYGMPELHLYNRSGNIIFNASATQVAADGTTATFPFPKQANGASLSGDIYGMSVINWDSAPETFCEPIFDEPIFDDGGRYIGDYCWEVPGESRLADTNYAVVGTSASIANAPFGVDAVSAQIAGIECYYTPEDPDVLFTRGGWDCINWNYAGVNPLLTLNESGQIYYRGSTLYTGSSPTAIQVYRNDIQFDSWDGSDYSYSQTTTQPSRALVVNTGSNSVTVVDLFGWVILANIPVGNRPVGLLITPDETKAYVANYDSSSVTEISLSTNTATRTVAVGYRPTSVTLDPSGTAIWVGGQGWMSKIDMVSFTAVATYPVNGTITSMGTSTGQNKLIYTVLTNDSAPDSTDGQAITLPSSTASLREMSFSDMTTIATITTGSGSLLQSVIPPITATGVSAKYGNGISVSAIPTGFVVMDVTGGVEIMRGTTPTPVHGIAADPAEGIVYVTVPGSNMVIMVPLPPL